MTTKLETTHTRVTMLIWFLPIISVIGAGLISGMWISAYDMAKATKADSKVYIQEIKADMTDQTKDIKRDLRDLTAAIYLIPTKE